uniref:Uncharacterized protein n=1 Tax=Heterorhabditis bacteriophora TaxID=37862 RepID=A0A1I7WQW6_HETBA
MTSKDIWTSNNSYNQFLHYVMSFYDFGERHIIVESVSYVMDDIVFEEIVKEEEPLESKSSTILTLS